ncbi:VOC family protein [Kribbella sandramycini]|uniref:Putative glyoxalase superfamily protein PhnB n=1 Tax=Kribbella sandramycini TaxID=60450 RepID=A0A7Y4KYV5_9ACTN|nr:VOC family protein [Kribbella sandramycini]MBB6568956.1 putative glyoxalase superfamily protein PhnB [Kribbella sandramycini]NOL41199.1 VOC family protein [Kribbella sandramycini]
MTVSPIPAGYTSITPWILGKDTAGLMKFLAAAFGAEELFPPVADERGVIGHAEMRIGDAVVMMFDMPDWPPTPAFLRLYVDDVPATLRNAVAAGGTVVTEPTHMFWGDIVARVHDRYGNLYWLQSRIELVDEDELNRRYTDPKFIDAMNYVQSALYKPEI